MDIQTSTDIKTAKQVLRGIVEQAIEQEEELYRQCTEMLLRLEGLTVPEFGGLEGDPDLDYLEEAKARYLAEALRSIAEDFDPGVSVSDAGHAQS